MPAIVKIVKTNQTPTNPRKIMARFWKECIPRAVQGRAGGLVTVSVATRQHTQARNVRLLNVITSYSRTTDIPHCRLQGLQ
jgi:hypothetical protein